MNYVLITYSRDYDDCIYQGIIEADDVHDAYNRFREKEEYADYSFLEAQTVKML